MPLSFGNFDEMCRGAALIVCPVLDSDMGIQPVCYSRNVNLAGNIIFQPGACARRGKTSQIFCRHAG